MSAADCLLSLAQLSARLFARGGRGDDRVAQREMVDAVAGDGPLARILHQKFDGAQWSAVFFR